MIKTTMGKVIGAYVALSRVRNKVKGRTALDLFLLKSALQPSVDFASEEDQKLVMEHGGAVTQAGMVIIADKGKRAEFQKARDELNNMDCEIDTDPVCVDLEKNPDITMEDIEQLTGFVEFV